MNRKEIVCYETDASRIKGSAEKIFFPEKLEDVISIVKNSRTDIVPRGSGTGLVGGCVPSNSIVVDMGRMNKVSNFLPLKKTIKAEAGITLKELNEKLNQVGFEFPIDSSNNEISTIGGMIATNSSGDRNMRYGSIKDWIEEIEFVNGKGELSKTSKADLSDVCGMEGITGIIVAATIKLAPLIQRSASIFQSDNINEVLSIARKLRSEKEVVILELFPPFVSKLSGLPEKYNLIIEFNSLRGKMKDNEYSEISRLRKNVFYELFSEGYYNVEDPKFFFDKIKEFITLLEENEIPYIGHLGVGIIHPFFREMDKEKRERIIEFIKKMKASPGKFGIGITRKYFVDGFQVKLIQRVKARHDPMLKFNRGKVIDIFHHTISRIKKPKMEEEKTGLKEKEAEEAVSGEELSAVKVIDNPPNKGDTIKGIGYMGEINTCDEEKTPEEKMENFIKEIELKDKIEKIELREEIEGEAKEIKEKETALEKEEKTEKIEKKEKEEEIGTELSFEEVKEKLRDYEDTFKSELKGEKMQEVEKIARNIPRDIIKKESELGPMVRREKVKVDYNQIRDIMTNRKGGKNEVPERGKVTVDDNLDSKNSIVGEDKDIINRIMDRYKKDDEREKEKKENGEELI